MSISTIQGQTVIIGAGPAGLAVGACLKRAGLPSVLLEQAGMVGAVWHRHYQRLHLHTPKSLSGLPYLPFPTTALRYPPRNQVINYLESYAQHFGLSPRFGQRVSAARYLGGQWEIQTQDSLYRAVNLVVAAGYARTPTCPTWPGQAEFDGPILHSSSYRSGADFRGQRVLVVGFGNSGSEIALDLWAQGAQPSLSVRGPVNVLPRDLFGVPILAVGLAESWLPPAWADTINAPILRGVLGDLSKLGLQKSPRGPLSQISRDQHVPVLDIGTISLIRLGKIRVFPGLNSLSESGVTFTNGQTEPFDAVVLATGYRPQVNDFLEGVPSVYDDHGTPLASGQATPVPGLYFCGYQVAATGMLREIGLEARRIAGAIAGQL